MREERSFIGLSTEREREQERQVLFSDAALSSYSSDGEEEAKPESATFLDFP